MKSVFIAGTAGSGKSLLTSKIKEYYASNGAFAGALNLDPGVEELPYAADIDVRGYIDMVSLMKQHGLGPNGALIMANDLIASRVDDLQGQVDGVNPDYLIVDTPGQIELFAYRTSGPFVVGSLRSEEKVGIFLFDGALISTPANFVSVALLATSVRLRLGIPMINVLTKSDLIENRLGEILRWSTNLSALEDAVASEVDGEAYTLITGVLRGLNLGGFAQGIIPVSNVTGYGMANLHAALSRTISMGEEVED